MASRFLHGKLLVLVPHYGCNAEGMKSAWNDNRFKMMRTTYHDLRIHVFALEIAVAAIGLRFSLLIFPLSHPDEPIVAALMKRSVEQGRFTANWAGFAPQWWSRPTYQFSPYSLTASALARGAHSFTGKVLPLRGYVLLARILSCCCGALAVWLVFCLGRACFGTGAALCGEAILAMCFLHLQDSIYAHVDAFLCCLVLLSFLLTVHAAKHPGRYVWLIAACVSVGVTLAAKYNALAGLTLVAWIPIHWAREKQDFGAVRRSGIRSLSIGGRVRRCHRNS